MHVLFFLRALPCQKPCLAGRLPSARPPHSAPGEGGTRSMTSVKTPAKLAWLRSAKPLLKAVDWHGWSGLHLRGRCCGWVRILSAHLRGEGRAAGGAVLVPGDAGLGSRSCRGCRASALSVCCRWKMPPA